MIWFAVDAPRTHLLEHYLLADPLLRDHLRQVTYPELFRTRTLPRGAWVFISLDGMSPAELQMAAHLAGAARDAGLPVLNQPGKALSRYELLETLYKAGINEFRARRASGPLDSVRYPVFVREADEHHGTLTPLLYDRSQLRWAIAYLRLRGFTASELLVVEFCQTIGTDGNYRKYGIFRIGDRYVPRSVQAGPHWMTKHDNRSADEKLIAEDLTYVRDNPHAAWAREIFERAHIDYGRLDYGVRNGRPQAWEINVTPMIVANPAHIPDTDAHREFRRLIQPALQIALDGLREAFLHLDPGAIPGEPVQVRFPPDLERAAERERDALRALERRRRRIDSISAAPVLRRAGPLLRRMLSW